MFGERFQRSGGAQERVAQYAGGGEYVRHDRFPFRQRSRLIQHNGVDLVGNFQTFRRFYQNAVFCALARADHDGGRCGKPQRTGAGNDEYGNTDGKRKSKGLPQHQPDDGGKHCDADDNGHEHAADLIRQLRNGGFGGAGFFYQRDNLRKCRIIPDTCCLHFEIAAFVYSCANDGIAGLLFYGNGFACNRAFIHSGKAL